MKKIFLFLCFITASQITFANVAYPITYHDQATQKNYIENVHGIEQSNIQKTADNSISSQEHMYGLWDFQCVRKTYPDRHSAVEYSNGKQINVDVCTAKQTTSDFLNNRLVTAYAEISPFSVLFKTYNMIVEKNKAELIFQDNKTFSLSVDCHDTYPNEICMFAISNEKLTPQVKREMGRNNHFILSMTDNQTKQQVSFLFSLDHYSDIYEKLRNDERHIQESFKNAFPGQYF